MTEQNITIIPIMESGKGSAIRVKVGDRVYISDYSTEQLTSTTIETLFNSMKEQFNKNDVEDIELKFNELLDSIKKMEEEDAYREAHPEEFMKEPFTENEVVA